ncbi:TetR/AcrR family transcriptional regulator [Paenibacillus pabuli]|uniref:TetR/AcrR family transcriptional regulator n=1 Tax=Paenibacillus pabuli TaxID=1472 RepID=UPI003CE67055
MDKTQTSEFLTKEQIIAATQETLRRFGVAKTSVTDVAKLLGVSHGTIYRHYKSKKELLEGVTEQWLEDEIIAPLTEITQDQDYIGEGIQHLKVYIEALMDRKRHHAESDAELFEMYARVTQESADIINKHVQHLVSHLSEIIQQQQQFNFDHPDQVATAILQATARFHHPAHAYEWKSPNIDAEFAQVWLLIEKGLLHLDEERK